MTTLDGSVAQMRANQWIYRCYPLSKIALRYA